MGDVEDDGEKETAGWIVGGVVAVLGVIGLFASSHETDPAFYGFGLALFGFAVLFVFLLVKRAFDAREPRSSEGQPGEDGFASGSR